ncbi:MAG: hypothetical protein WBQ73_00975 [Candidatus Babeliales bacterium]
MKKNIRYLCLYLLIMCQTSCSFELDVHSIFHFIDNNRLLTMKDMFNVFEAARAIHKLLNARYSYNNKLHTIPELAELERQFPHLINDVLFTSLLKQAKEDFSQQLSSLMTMMNIGKKFIILCIKKWALESQNPNSPLLSWEMTAQDGENESFHSSTNSFDALSLFLQDLLHFLHYFTIQCPQTTQHFIHYVQQLQK